MRPRPGHVRRRPVRRLYRAPEWQRGEKAVQKELAAKGPGKAYTSAELLAELADA